MIHDRALVKAILEHADAYAWTLQGLGMLRTYISPELRLHVWSGDARSDGVSEIHTHPWQFSSLVIAGRVVNVRFDETQNSNRGTLDTYKRQAILCGEGGGLVGDPDTVHLAARQQETYLEGHIYQQRADEIHRSLPEDGTVTLIYRQFLEDADHAYVYWPEDCEWGSAEPRPATDDEVARIVGVALDKWF